MKISINKAAKVSYKIHIENNKGELIEFADENNPRLLVFGNQTLLPGFETHMEGLEAGQDFEFSLTPDESFGSYKQDLIVDVPKSAFVINGELKEDLLFLGNEISMLDNNGNVVSGKVIEIFPDNVKMDFNHRLAGKGLYVTGTIQHVRDVTPEDLAPKSGGCGSGCGCGSGSDSKDSCGTDENKYEDDCPSCGNPAELRGKGHGNCGCG